MRDLKVRFQETIEEHRARLGESFNHVRTHRRILTALFTGRTINETDDISKRKLRDMLEASMERAGQPITRPDRVLSALLAGTGYHADGLQEARQAMMGALMTELQVQPVKGRITTRGEAYIQLSPTIGLPALAHQVNAPAKEFRQPNSNAGSSGDKAPRVSVAYGYRREGDQLVPDPPASQAIEDAFYLILELERDGRAPWAQVADELNEQGYVRKDGREWSGDDVRELTRVTTYAGYKADKRASKYGDEIELDPNITPIVDLVTFVKAARLGRGRNAPWLSRLEAIVEASLPAWERV